MFSNVNFRNVRKYVEKKMGLERKALSENKEELKTIMAVFGYDWMIKE